MNFILIYVVFLVGTMHTVVGVKTIDAQADRIRSGELPPIVVPAEMYIPWLTEESTKARMEWEGDHAR